MYLFVESFTNIKALEKFNFLVSGLIRTTREKKCHQKTCNRKTCKRVCEKCLSKIKKKHRKQNAEFINNSF